MSILNKFEVLAQEKEQIEDQLKYAMRTNNSLLEAQCRSQLTSIIEQMNMIIFNWV